MSVINVRSVLIGIGATLTMDVLTVAAIKLRLIAPLRPQLIGRWFASIAQGRPCIMTSLTHHRSITNLRSLCQCTMRLASLRAVVSACKLDLRNQPAQSVTALGFALCTNLLPWLLMFPAMGYGWFGTHGAAGTRLLLSSFATHSLYGLGLWIGVLVKS